jgi:hypothetical protein
MRNSEAGAPSAGDSGEEFNIDEVDDDGDSEEDDSEEVDEDVDSEKGKKRGKSKHTKPQSSSARVGRTSECTLFATCSILILSIGTNDASPLEASDEDVSEDEVHLLDIVEVRSALKVSDIHRAHL